MPKPDTQDASDRELISKSQTDQVSGCRLTLLSEERYACLAQRRGVTVHTHRGRFWRNSDQFGPLILVPVHWMAELTPEQATFPKPYTVGIKARVGGGSKTNAFFNLYLIDRPAEYGFNTIGSNARAKIRKACRDGVTVDLATPELLEEQGYEVTKASLEKSGYRPPPSRRSYIKRLADDTFMSGARLVLAGFIPVDKDCTRLGAIATGSAIDGTAYGDDLYVAPWARRSNVGPRVIFSFIEACQRTPGIDRIVLGRATSDQALDSFKASFGVPLKDVPAMVALRPGAGKAVALVSGAAPLVHRRLYGR